MFSFPPATSCLKIMCLVAVPDSAARPLTTLVRDAIIMKDPGIAAVMTGIITSTPPATSSARSPAIRNDFGSLSMLTTEPRRTFVIYPRPSLATQADAAAPAEAALFPRPRPKSRHLAERTAITADAMFCAIRYLVYAM
jgi:hypothetical protein